jgi:hypothetical protein
LQHGGGAHLARSAINFSGEVSGAIKQLRAARSHKQTFINENEHSSKQTNIHRGCGIFLRRETGAKKPGAGRRQAHP